jgi:pyridoxal phosphate enzyme (YggS family)
MSATIGDQLDKLTREVGSGVQLVAVSKTKPNAAIVEAYAHGHRAFGENRVQEMVDKYEALPKDIQWHMIGHVQSNKIKYFAPFVHMVHGMDKPKRFAELNKEAGKHQRMIDCLLQVHIAEEESKFGFDTGEAEAFFEQDLSSLYPNLRLRGLMGMATNTSNEAIVRKEFRSLKQLFDQLKRHTALTQFDTLSMGMSGDYRLAIEEGSTMVRIGSAIFGAR